MKKCFDCNIDMIENVRVEGQKKFDVGVDGSSRILLSIPTGEKTAFLGMNVDKTLRTEVMARVCPKCGKVEMYVDIDKTF